MIKTRRSRRSNKSKRISKRYKRRWARPGFTLAELLVGSAVMLVVIVGTLTLYMKSNRITVDQQQYTELQHAVRASMYWIARDVRSAAVNLPDEFRGYCVEGTDNENQGTEVTPDRLIVMGNMEDPLSLTLSNYQGSAANAAVADYSFEQHHYPDEFYEGKIVLILPNPTSGCRKGEVREITHVTHDTGGTNEKVNFSPGLAPDVNPPGGLSGECDPNDYDGGSITFIEVKEFWLDTSGSISGLTADKGYLSEAGVLYMSQNGYHYPLAHNVENLQFEYRGDFNDDGTLDAFRAWDPNWTGDVIVIGKICDVRISVLGRTEKAYVSVSGAPPGGLALYRRPDIANTAGDAVDDYDMHRRFLLQSTVNVRNLSVSLYNDGTR